MTTTITLLTTIPAAVLGFSSINSVHHGNHHVDHRHHHQNVFLTSSSCSFTTISTILHSTKLSTTGSDTSSSKNSNTLPTTKNGCPEYSPATGLKNEFYSWKENQQIRYQCSHTREEQRDIIEKTGKALKTILLVHGLFVNSDHWRKTLVEYEEIDDYIVYALDMFGCGYSDKPQSNTITAQLCNGEKSRFNNNNNAVLRNVKLGTANGGSRIADIELRHPLHSPYNFYTWCDLLCDFVQDIIHKDDPNDNNMKQEVTIMCNSIGSISSLQAFIEKPELFNGLFIVCPNFRELHSAEVAIPFVTMPILRFMQKLLREGLGQYFFNILANPSTVKQILKEPYAIHEAVDDTLVQVLLDPLLTPGASDVVFDTLSYSAGPLPEQQLGSIVSSSTKYKNKPIWVCYGTADPWTPAARVEALIQYPIVKRVIPLPGIGHCPHDEAPELVDPLLAEFLQSIQQQQQQQQ